MCGFSELRPGELETEVRKTTGKVERFGELQSGTEQMLSKNRSMVWCRSDPWQGGGEQSKLNSPHLLRWPAPYRTRPLQGLFHMLAPTASFQVGPDEGAQRGTQAT